MQNLLWKSDIFVNSPLISVSVYKSWFSTIQFYICQNIHFTDIPKLRFFYHISISCIQRYLKWKYVSVSGISLARWEYWILRETSTAKCPWALQLPNQSSGNQSIKFNKSTNQKLIKPINQSETNQPIKNQSINQKLIKPINQSKTNQPIKNQSTNQKPI